MASFAERQLDLLGSQDPVTVLRGTAGRIEALVSKLGESGLERSRGAGKWSAREILAHLADMEIVFGYRFRQVLAEQPHALQGVDQDAWSRRYAAARAGPALAAFKGLRLWNLALVEGLSEAELSRRYTHPDRGEETLARLLRLWAGHDLNHLSQMEGSQGI